MPVHEGCDCRGLIFGVCAYEWDVMTSGEQREVHEEYREYPRCPTCSVSHRDDLSKRLCPKYDGPLKVFKSERRPPGRPRLELSLQSNDRWFVTVNAKDDVDPIRFWARAEKTMSMVKSEYMIMSLEQRGVEVLQGWHIHIYVEYGKKVYKSKVIQVFANSFVDYVGSDNYIDVRIGGEHHIGYIQGNKVDEKMEKVSADIVWKEHNNIPRYKEKVGEKREKQART